MYQLSCTTNHFSTKQKKTNEELTIIVWKNPISIVCEIKLNIPNGIAFRRNENWTRKLIKCVRNGNHIWMLKACVNQKRKENICFSIKKKKKKMSFSFLKLIQNKSIILFLFHCRWKCFSNCGRIAKVVQSSKTENENIEREIKNMKIFSNGRRKTKRKRDDNETRKRRRKTEWKIYSRIIRAVANCLK